MSKTRTLLVGLITTFAVLAVMPAGAGAAAIYRYQVQDLGTGADGDVYNLDSTKRTTIRVMRGITELHRKNQGSGSSSIWFNSAAESGDVIEVYQHPAGDPVLPDPPGVPPTETFVIPPLTVDAAPGNPVVTGAAADGWAVRVLMWQSCEWMATDSRDAIRVPGAYSAQFPFPALAGGGLRVTQTSPVGDLVSRRATIAGDGRCIDIDALLSDSTSTNPYRIEIDGLDPAGPSVRTVLRRAGAALADNNNDTLWLSADKRPSPGDVIEVYRPEGAPTPAFIYTIPSYGAIVDQESNLIAANVEAGSQLGVWACRRNECSVRSERGTRSFGAGRTIFDLGAPFDTDRPYDILPNDLAGAWWVSADEQASLSFDAAPGDLTPPVGRITLAKRIKLARVARKQKFKLTSNEAGRARCSLTIPSTAGRGSSAAARTITLATSKGAVKAGRNTLTLKATKTGKKAIARLLSQQKSVKATLTVTLSDSAGNVSTVVKRVKLGA